MVKVKLLVSFASASGAYAPGDVYEADEREASRMIAAGFAEPIAAKKKPAVETAADTSAVETATAD